MGLLDELRTAVEDPYETKLNPDEEKNFQVWRAANVDPKDSGIDYDFRGAWKDNQKSAINQVDGKPHWSDKYKKPGHPTFSVESVYAKDRPDLAGTWGGADGETYIPPGKAPKSNFLAELAAEIQKPPATPEKPKGFFGSFAEGATRAVLGIKEAGQGGAALATGGEPTKSGLTPDRLAEIRAKPMLERFTDPDFVGDFLGSSVVGSVPFLAGATIGSAAGGASPVPGGALIGGAVGGGLAVAMQTVGPAYLEARQKGLDHEAAVTSALEQAGVQGSIAGAMVPLAAARPFRTAVSNALFQLVAQPVVAAGGKATGNEMAGRPREEGVPEAAIGAAAFQGPILALAMRGTGAAGPFTPEGTPGSIGPTAEVNINGAPRTIQTAPGTALPTEGAGGGGIPAGGVSRETMTQDQIQASATDTAFGPTETPQQTMETAAAQTQANDLAARSHEVLLAADRANVDRNSGIGVADFSEPKLTPAQQNARIDAERAQAAAGDAAAADRAERLSDEYHKNFMDVAKNASSQVFDELEHTARAAMEGAKWPVPKEDQGPLALMQEVRGREQTAFRDNLAKAMEAAGDEAAANDVRMASALELRDAAAAIVAERDAMARQTTNRRIEGAMEAGGSAAADQQGGPMGPPTPTSTPGKGFVARVLGALRGAQPVRGTARLVGDVGSQWAKPLTQRVGDTNVPIAKPFEQAALRATDESNRLIGRWQVVAKSYLDSIRGKLTEGPNGEGRVARRELGERVPVPYQGEGPLVEYGYTKFQRGVENDGDLVRLSPAAQKVVRKFREFMQATARDIEAIKTPMGEPIMMTTADGQVPFHGARDGARLIRQWTPEMWRIMQLGPDSDGYKALAQALAHANGLEEPAALRHLDALRQSVLERSSAVEVARVFKEFPTYIRVAGKGGAHEVPLLHTDPFSAVGHITRNLALRVGYIKEFGQNLGGGDSFGEQAVQKFNDQGGRASDAIGLVRALQGIPIDEPSARFAPGTPEYETLRTVDALRNTNNATLLSRSWIPNATEPVAKTPTITGARAAGKAFVGLLTSPKYREAVLQETAERGFRTIDHFDWMMEPGRARESIARMARQTFNVGGMKVNEWNELHAAGSALEKIKKLEQGNGTELDRARLEMLRFSKPEIDRLMGGLHGTPEAEAGALTELYNRAGRRMVEYSQGTTALPANLSRASNSRTYRWIINFDRYAQMTANRFQRHVAGMTDAVKEHGPLSPEFRAQAKLASGFVFGHGLSGMGALLLTDLVRDGMTGVKDRVDRAGNSLGDAKDLMEASFRYAALSGAGDILMRGIEKPTAAEGLSSMAASTVPGRYYTQVRDWMAGEKAYKNLSGTDAALKLIETNFPIAPAVKQLASQIGLADRDNRREVATNRMWEWVRKNQGTGSGAIAEDPESTVAAAIDKHRDFSVALKKLEVGIRQGKAPSEIEPLRTAAIFAGTKSGTDIHKALLGKRLIPKIQKDNRVAARKWLGEENWQALEKYDRMLTYWADSLPGAAQ